MLRRGNGNKKRKFTSNIIMKIAKTSNTTSQMEIPIVFITDNNYVLPTGVAIKSLILNKKPKTLYRIYVIITDDVTAENKKKLVKCGRKKAPVELIDVDTGVLEEFRVPGYHVQPSALLKFNIAGLLPQYDKILYLDGDILVKGDLSELYAADISNAYLGAVSDLIAVTVAGWTERLKIINYFNSGVLLLNAARMRKEKFEELLYDIKKANPDYICMDQDVFNAAVKEEVFFFPLKYNVMLHNFIYTFNAGVSGINDHYGTSYKSYDDLLEDAVIIHLTNEVKPWKYRDAVLHKEWMKYFRKSSFRFQKLPLLYFYKKEKDELERLKKLALEKAKKEKRELKKLEKIALKKARREKRQLQRLKMKRALKEVLMKVKKILKIALKNLPVIKQINGRYWGLRNLLNEQNIILKDIMNNLKLPPTPPI